MKILMLSIFAPHFFNWAGQLEDSGHEVYWLDIFDSNTKVGQIGFAEQITGWRYKWDFPGRYYLKEKTPVVTRLINRINERKFYNKLDEVIREIQPDAVHSFVMYLAAAPVREVMKEHPKIKWIYSSWGSDLYFYRKREKELREIRETLPEVDYMFADCHRDFEIAVENNFKGKFLGVFPGGGGVEFELYNSFMLPYNERRTILVKGYQGLHGRCISVLKALWKIRGKIESKGYEIVIFGAGEEVKSFIVNSPFRDWEVLQVLETLPHQRVMELMGKAAIYIGNSLSDGTPNTLLEAIVMGAFPIQSNPGGATGELIKHRKNGLLIETPEDSDEIAELLEEAFNDPEFRKIAVDWNLQKIKPGLERGYVKEKVLKAYQSIEEEL